MVREVLVPILKLVEVKVTFHVVYQRTRNGWGSFRYESLKQYEPRIEEFFAIRISHLHIELILTVLKLLHDNRKDSDADPHTEQTNYLFKVAYWEKISIADCREHC